MQKISIILPVHNGEKYLDALLSAFRRQRFGAFVCYVINDGSTDGSELIIKKYCSVDTRFVMVSQEHLGRFAGYNRGMEQRLFDYSLFWDADDIPGEQMLELLYEACQEHDIAVAGIGELSDTLEEIDIENTPRYVQQDMDALLRIALTSPKEDVLSGVLIRTSLINNLRFVNGSQKYADLLFYISLLGAAQTLVFVDAMLLKKHRKQSVYGAFDRGTLAVSALDTLESVMQKILSMPAQFHRLGLEYAVNKSMDLAIFLRKEHGDIPYYAKCRIKAICRQYWRWFVRSRHAGLLSKVYASLLCLSFTLFYTSYESVQYIKKSFHKVGLYWGSYPKKLRRKELKRLRELSNIPKRKRKWFWQQGR